MKDNINFLELTENLLSHVPGRSRDIVKKRFGLEKGEAETLEAIGRSVRITRERVRQIIGDVLKTVSEKLDQPEFRSGETHLLLAIDEKSGILKERDVTLAFGFSDFREANAARFVAESSKAINIFEEKGHISRSWTRDKSIVELARRVAEEARAILEREKALLTEAELARRIAKTVPELEERHIPNFLKVLERVQKNAFGKWGLRHWLEVNPKGTREKIYLVLKEEERPLHFKEIAALIDKHKLGKKKAHPQTVHNELIKDKRFVLIGRGIYALREWGYSEGTIQDVLRDILAGSEKPLQREEILKKVMAVRQVKKTTVMINLNNTALFLRKNDLYSLKR
jgi:DNA-directed RNA polymerase delta subunit